MALSRHANAMTVEISDTQGHLRVDHGELAGLVRQALLLEDRHRASLSIALVDDATIHAVNRAHLGHDWPTDVISFPLSGAEDEIGPAREDENDAEDEYEDDDNFECGNEGGDEAGGGALVGELVVSAERALAVARELGAAPFAELALYVVHGLLHLCGHDDADGPAAAAMRRREDEILIALGLGRPARRAPEDGPVEGPRPFAAPLASGPSEPCS